MVFTTGIIGYGARGQVLARVIRDHVPSMSLIAVADPSPERRAEAVRSGLNVYENLEALLSKANPQIVVIATNASLHCEQVIMAAEHGCHIVCEKPLAYFPAQTDRMMSAVRKAGVICAVDYETVFASSFPALQACLSSPDLGELLYVNGTCKGRPPAYDMVTDLPHFLHSLMILLGSGPEKVFSHIIVDGRSATLNDVRPMSELYPQGRPDGFGMRADVIHASYLYPRNIAVSFSMAKLENSGSKWMNLVFHGTKGRVMFHETGGGYVHWSGDPEDTPTAAPWELVYAPETPDTEWVVPTARLFQDVVDAITHDRDPVSNMQAAASIVSQICGIYVAHLDEKPVTFPLKDRRHPLAI